MQRLEVSMNAIELNAVAHDGQVSVTIPERYRDAWNERSVRVILMMDEEPSKQPPQSLLTRLKQIKITGPEDFSAEHDAYLSGEKDA
ncbi:MAG TPA: hypothetical protein DDY14_00870 [Chromatiaceae bacterium]|jgi:hypothetical protein|nr:MAG: hypothetical protein N838_16595 [Thiohalocapsa sp. PB-PSB1]HBG93885.1 hypothetical protein [Chromatiaceae bacterium]